MVKRREALHPSASDSGLATFHCGEEDQPSLVTAETSQGLGTDPSSQEGATDSKESSRMPTSLPLTLHMLPS